MVYTFSAKYDVQQYYPKLVRTMLMVGVAGLAWFKTYSDQKAVHDRLIRKYLAAYSDDDLQNFDVIMNNHL